MKELGCPACHRRFRVEDDALSVPAGRAAVVVCPFCATESPAQECEREPGRQLAELAKVAVRERDRRKRETERAEKVKRRESKRAAKLAKEEAQQREEEKRFHELTARDARQSAEDETCREGRLEQWAVAEIGAMRIVGLGLIMLGLCVAIYLWDAAEEPSAALWGVGLAFVGFVTRCLGGIWGTLERIARK